MADRFQAAVVAQLTDKANWNETKNIYAGVQPGGGKTSIVCWTAKVINHLHEGTPVVIATTTVPLRKQLEAFAKQFNLTDTSFVDLKNLHYCDEDSVIIFDEYYHAVFKDKLTINGEGTVLGIHGLGSLGARRLLLGGVCGSQFKKEILPKLMENPVFIDRFTSMFSMLKQPTDGGAAVTARARLDDLRNEACEFIVRRASVLPVIVIGGDSLAPRLRAELGDIKVHTVKMEKDVTFIKSIQETISKGVILLH